MKYKDIRENYQSRVAGLTIIDKYCMLVSPVFTKVFVRYNIIPNDVTILMILSGLLGGVLFFVDNIIIKIIGIIFIHLWYIFDCSDGEVARITKKFSMFGKELDYMAHTVNHPLILMAYAYSLKQISALDGITVISVFFILCVLDMINRQLLSMDIIYGLKIKSDAATTQNQPNSLLHNLKAELLMFFGALPNFVLLFPLVYLVDYFLKTDFSTIYLLIEVVLLFLWTVHNTLKLIIKIKNK